LAVVGLLLVCLSVAALVYALTPVDKTREQYRLEPTLFSPPQSYRVEPPAGSDWAIWPKEPWT
jgi:hypothetical protein